MNKLANVKSGEIYAIPLFLSDYSDVKSFSRDKFQESDKQFVFCRVIEDLNGGGILVEVFDKIGNLDTHIDKIVSSERLFNPITVSGVGIYKKRWKKLGQQSDFNKYRDSLISEITLVAGFGDDLRLWKGGYDVGEINEQEASKHERWTVWRSSQLEKRILKELFG